MYKLQKSGLCVKPPPQQIVEGVEIKDPLQSSFCYLIIGKPGSGKTYLIQQFLLDKQFYFQKYDSVIFISPSKMELLSMGKTNWTQSFNLDWIYEQIELLNKKQYQNPNMLIIIDDFIDQLFVNRQNTKLINLIFNRRHLLDKKGIISIIITSQKYKLVPTVFRSCYTALFVFKLNQEDWKFIKEDNIFQNGKSWDQIIKTLFVEQYGIRPFMFFNKQTDQIYRNFDKIQLCDELDDQNMK